jgi:hypothetical protein
MCGCLVLVVGAMFPRFALVLIELFSDWNDRAFDSFWIPYKEDVGGSSPSAPTV